MICLSDDYQTQRRAYVKVETHIYISQKTASSSGYVQQYGVPMSISE